MAGGFVWFDSRVFSVFIAPKHGKISSGRPEIAGFHSPAKRCEFASGGNSNWGRGARVKSLDGSTGLRVRERVRKEFPFFRSLVVVLGYLVKPALLARLVVSLRVLALAVGPAVQGLNPAAHPADLALDKEMRREICGWLGAEVAAGALKPQLGCLNDPRLVRKGECRVLAMRAVVWVMLELETRGNHWSIREKLGEGKIYLALSRAIPHRHSKTVPATLALLEHARRLRRGLLVAPDANLDGAHGHTHIHGVRASASPILLTTPIF